ncbi:MAG: Ldh family oxidoreductase, partial [Planktomarina sp.]|uniref:Ldh family oxidoreductase n=1 Tax=Planktomarina sp. TaxID=2024851 RepID=UPI003C357CFC
GEAKEFGIDVDKYIDWVKASPLAPGFDAVLIPGDPERLCTMDRRKNGIPLDAGTIEQLIAAAKSVNVTSEQITKLSSAKF